MRLDQVSAVEDALLGGSSKVFLRYIKDTQEAMKIRKTY